GGSIDLLNRDPGVGLKAFLAQPVLVFVLAQTFISGTAEPTRSGGSVNARISSTVVPGARSFNTRPLRVTSMTARSVMIMLTTPTAVSGSVQAFRIFFSLPRA